MKQLLLAALLFIAITSFGQNQRWPSYKINREQIKYTALLTRALHREHTEYKNTVTPKWLTAWIEYYFNILKQLDSLEAALYNNR